MPKIDVVCSYCKRRYGEKFTEKEQIINISHGLCPDCEPIVQQAYKKDHIVQEAVILFLKPQLPILSMTG
jgi:hypothetical protein